MFPIIPQHFQTSFLSHTKINQRPIMIKQAAVEDIGCVIASGSIPVNSVSQIFNVDQLCHVTEDEIKIPVKIELVEDILRPIHEADKTRWPRCIRLSEDIQSHNALLETIELSDTTPGVRIRTIKHISDGEEIKIWYSEQIVAVLNIPFLTPANIQGQKCYICHICGRSYEYPNPLKIHLTLSCGRLPNQHIWERLRKSLNLNTLPLNLSNKNIFNLNLHISQNSTKVSQSSSRSSPSPDSKRHSAFKPYATTSMTPCDSPSFSQSTTVILPQQNYNFTYKTSLPGPHLPTPNDSLTTIAYNNHASQMETIVSNLGKSKEGHLCIYCGKVYSRKYGLKIHIRTHTGFKPLKCKYCFRAFGDPSNLNKHVRLHAQGGSPYSCELCGKILVRRRDLQRHLQTRHGPSGHGHLSVSPEHDCDSNEIQE